jgi:hypothetical protein
MSPSPYRGGITGRRGGYDQAAVNPRYRRSHGKLAQDSRSESEEGSGHTGSAGERDEATGELMPEPKTTMTERTDELTPEQLALARSISPELASSLVSLKRTIDKKSVEAPHTAEIIQLPLWPEPARAMPNSALRSALFSAIQSKDRRFINDKVITAVGGVEIRFKGEQLNQEDLDVCAQLFHLARVHPLGIICEFAANGFLKAIGRDTGGRSHNDLDRSIMRLQQPLKIELSRYTFSGQLVGFCEKDKLTKRYKLKLNSELAGLFSCGWTGLDWQQRRRLRRRPLALWLHAFYATHDAPFPYRVATLRELCGSQTTALKRFRMSLRAALKKLEAIGAIRGYDIDERDTVHVFKAKTITQKKARKPRRKTANWARA